MAGPARKTAVIPVNGVVDPGLKAFLQRATQDAQADGAKIIIYEIDTFGGEVESALEISDIITGVDSSVLTIAYVKTKAISAGALIALSCNRLAMKDNTTIGDCAPIAYTKEGPQMLGEKFQSPLRAKFRSLAKRNHYPALLAESMVSDDIEVVKVRTDSGWTYLSQAQVNEMGEKEKAGLREKTTVVAKGRLLTMDAREAKDLGFVSYLVGSEAELLGQLDVAQPVNRIVMSWSENMVRIIRKISPILLLIGMAGIALEIKSPGLVWPGTIGVACFAVVFGGQYLSGLANYGEILLFILGVALIIIEIHFIPGFGFAGILGIVLVVLSIVLSFQSFVIPKPGLPWQATTLEKNLLRAAFTILGGFVVFLVTARWLVTTSGFSRLILRDSEEAKEGFHAAPAGLESLAGCEGLAESTLRPAGIIRVDEKLYDAVSEGGFIPKGRKIRVLTVQGNRVVVKEIA